MALVFVAELMSLDIQSQFKLFYQHTEHDFCYQKFDLKYQEVTLTSKVLKNESIC